MDKSVLSTGMIKYWPHLLKALNLLRLPARFLDLSIWIGRRFITIGQLQNGFKKVNVSISFYTGTILTNILWEMSLNTKSV